MCVFVCVRVTSIYWKRPPMISYLNSCSVVDVTVNGSCVYINSAFVS